MRASDVAAQASDTGNPAAGLRAVAELRRLTDTLERTQVEAALAVGLGWPEIAVALGVTRQAVHKKYAKRVPKNLRPRRGPTP